MNARKLTVVVAPLLLLVALSGLRWVQWKNDHPPLTVRDTRLRRILLSGNTFQFGVGGKFLSPAQQKEVVAHFWTATATATREAKNPSPGSADEAEIYFHPSPHPGQGKIVLSQDPAFDYLDIEWWGSWPQGDGSPPITTSEEQFELHPATSHFLHTWLAQQK
jgi:hypothetical protein